MMPKLRAYVKNGDKWLQIDSDKWGFLLKISPLLDSDVKVSDGMIVLETSKKHLVYSSGLTDFDGVEIFDKDIVKNIDSEELGVVEFDEGQFKVNFRGVSEQLWEIDKDIQIIGNTYRHPHLLERD
ncbi:YopX family protein [Staphylococcus caprae]|uniref:YopX protein domain-containing protein n=4 Tax=Staphylococcus TaxID=1279 RepID=A0ABM7FVS3_9STAP|nr:MULTISPECIES: YopX family protein [Staphylococcus]EES40383.1 putative phage conserved hypothetical protein TIGR01671 [Staphylococcus caprae M23864:W1]MBN6825289.1 hypothetical protein [Staphylococcus caprae]MDI0013517.1 YopX family protein [Staphylococcus caprae]QDW94296.1 hypothetical protein DWB96_08720 [Staphylococcus caprae]BAW91111.1 hypothetical protein JMUB0001_1613 [Staphylococcus capitis]